MATSRLSKTRQGYPCLERQKQESDWWISLKWRAVSRNSLAESASVRATCFLVGLMELVVVDSRES